MYTINWQLRTDNELLIARDNYCHRYHKHIGGRNALAVRIAEVKRETWRRIRAAK